MPQYIDIAVNLVGSQLESIADEVINDAIRVGVSPLITIGSHLEESQRAIKLCQQYKHKLYTTAGVHPHHASLWGAASCSELKKLATQNHVVAIGECGLDYNRDYSPRHKQREAFQAQLNIAVETKMPVLMHERDAHDDFVAILKEFRPHLSNALLHCFTGTQKELITYLDMDLHIGITGWVCDERRGTELASIVPLIPDNRIMIETDSPYLLPRSMRPKPKSSKNVPCYLPYISEYIAKLRKQEPKIFAQHCYQNSLHYFNIND